MRNDRNSVNGVLTRRRFLEKGTKMAAGLGAAGSLLQPTLKAFAQDGGLDRLVWISPRGTLEVMDDYNLWVPIKLGYFEELGLDVRPEPGPLEANAPTRFVAAGQSDVGFPSPAVFSSSVEAGMDIVSAWEMIMGQTFGFAFPLDSTITHPRQLSGKTIALGDPGWKSIVDVMLIEVGVDPKEVEYVQAGQQWGQVVSLGRVDAGLSWEGLRAQWDAQGLQLKYLLGQDWSKHPSNVYCVRREDLSDPARRDVLARFFKGCVMGFEFARHNPQAAAQITYTQFPGLQQQMTPEVAMESMRQNAYLYAGGFRRGEGWGWHDFEGWASYLNIAHEVGVLRTQLSPNDILTNEFVDAANEVDLARIERDASNFKLSAEWAEVELQGPIA